MNLALFVHADPSMRQRYQAQIGAEWTIAFVNKPAADPGLSSAYSRLALANRAPDGRIVPNLIAKYAPPADWYNVILITFSAGYALAREVLKSEADRDALAAYVALDSIHAATDAAGLPLAEHVAPFIAYAKSAAAGDAVFWLGHSDVKTYGYESTTETAAAIAEAVTPANGFFVRAYDVRPASQQRQEHGAALAEWGPLFVAGAVGQLDPGESPDPVVDDASYSERAKFGALADMVLDEALEDFRAGVREDLGRNDGTRIREYLENFSSLGLRPPLNWCALAVSEWMLNACDALDIDPPIKGSVGAQAFMAQMKASPRCRWLKPPELTQELARGAVVVWRRPPLTWTGHIGIVSSLSAQTFRTIEGNSGPAGDRVAQMTRNLDDPLLFGFGVFLDDTTGERQAEPPDHLSDPVRVADEWICADSIGDLLAAVDALWRGEAADPLSVVDEMIENLSSSGL